MIKLVCLKKYGEHKKYGELTNHLSFPSLLRNKVVNIWYVEKSGQLNFKNKKNVFILKSEQDND